MFFARTCILSFYLFFIFKENVYFLCEDEIFIFYGIFYILSEANIIWIYHVFMLFSPSNPFLESINTQNVSYSPFNGFKNEHVSWLYKKKYSL